MSFRTDKTRGRHPITPKKGIKETDLSIKEKGNNDTIAVSVKSKTKIVKPYTDKDFAHYYDDLLDAMMRGDLHNVKDFNKLVEYQTKTFEQLSESDKKKMRKELKELMDDYYAEFPFARKLSYKPFK